MKVEVSAIKIKIGNKTIELTADEARAMHKELVELFGKELVRYYPATYPVYTPIYIDRSVPAWPPRWEIICSSLSGTSVDNVGQTLLMSCNA